MVRTTGVIVLVLGLFAQHGHAFDSGGQAPDWQFRHNPTSLAGAWDIWHPPSGEVRASFFVSDSATPPDGQIVGILSFNNKADIEASVVLPDR
jgi:hypothetical protein